MHSKRLECRGNLQRMRPLVISDASAAQAEISRYRARLRSKPAVGRSFRSANRIEVSGRPINLT
jgi:hypothetical protein